MIILETIYILIHFLLNYIDLALLFKAIFRDRFCLIAYVIAQIIIFTEEIYRVAFYELLPPPSIFSKLPGTIAFLIFTIIITKLVLMVMKVPNTEFAIIFGSTFGTLGVFIIDSLHTNQMQPFYPISKVNPLFGIIEESLIAKFLVCSLLISVCIFIFRWLSQKNGESEELPLTFKTDFY